MNKIHNVKNMNTIVHRQIMKKYKLWTMNRDTMKDIQQRKEDYFQT